MIAKQRGKAVIGWVPKESHYRKSQTSLLGKPVSGWVHPFVESLTDYIANDLADMVKAISLFSSGDLNIKNKEIIDKAMNHYLESQYPNDYPMQNLIEGHPILEPVIA